MSKHVYSEHLQTVPVRFVEAKSLILDSHGKEISKMVIEPITEEQDNG